MSWLGDQFSSITDKISDFTKVLNDTSLTSDSADGTSNAEIGDNGAESFITGENEQRIASLLEENESLQRNIEELDQQHQEAINELLSQKNQVALENESLKKQLRDKERIEIDLSFLKYNRHSSKTMDKSGETEKKLYLLTFLNQFLTKLSPDSLSNYVLKLKSSLEEKHISEDTKKMWKSYIKFLESLCLENEPTDRIIQDVNSVFKQTIINNAKTDNKCISSQTETVSQKQCKSVDVISHATQTLNVSVNHINLQTDNIDITKPESYKEVEVTFSSSTSQTIELSAVNKTSQTETKSDDVNLQIDVLDASSDHGRIEELQSYIDELTEKVSRYENELTDLKNQKTLTCKCDILETELTSTKDQLHDFQNRCNTMRKDYSDNLNDLKAKLNAKDKTLAEKEAISQSQKKEILGLVSKLNGLKKSMNSGKNQDVEVKSPLDQEVITSKLKALESDKSQLSRELSVKTQECDKIGAECSILSNQLSLKTQECEKLGTECSDLSSELSLKTQECEKLDTEYSALSSKLSFANIS